MPLSIPPHPERYTRTFFSPLHPVPDTLDALPELGLRGAELLEGRGEVLQVLGELVLEVRELRRGKGGELDLGRGSAGLCGQGYARIWRGGEGGGEGEGEKGYRFVVVPCFRQGKVAASILIQ